jgi:hypothetical protein
MGCFVLFLFFVFGMFFRCLWLPQVLERNGCLVIEVMYLPSPSSFPHGILGQSVRSEAGGNIDGDISMYRVERIFDLPQWFNQFSVTDLWDQEFKMFKSRQVVSETAGWKSGSCSFCRHEQSTL